jgi:hypothetical protein
MLNLRASLKTGIAALLVATMTFGAMAPTIAVAQDRDRHDNRGGRDRGDRGRDNDRGREWRGDRGRDHDRGRNDWRGPRPEWRGDRHWGGPGRHVHVRPYPNYYRPYYVPRTRYYNHVHVHRPYGHAYPGFGFYYRDNDALRFLGLTALSLAVFSQLNENQQRAHEEAFVQATDAPLGDPIIWNEEGRSGSVTAVRDGVTPDGRQCREFQQQVTIGGNDEEAYGTACLQPDGSWQVVND